MAPATRKNEQDVPHPGGERQAELEAQLVQLRSEIAALQANNQAQRQRPTESKPRVPSNLPKFKGKRDEDLRQWLFQVETLCRISGHDAADDNHTLSRSREQRWRNLRQDDFCSGPADGQTWRRFTDDALSHFEASNYQAVLRQKLRQLRQVNDIEEYNGKYSSLIFRIEDMSEVDQVSYYCDGLKRATHAYVKLQNATTLSEAMDQAAKYEVSYFGGEPKTTREKPRREQQSRGRTISSQSSDMKPFSKKPFKPGHYAPAEQTKEGPVCYYCKKPGHFKRDCKKLKSDEGNDQPRQ